MADNMNSMDQDLVDKDSFKYRWSKFCERVFPSGFKKEIKLLLEIVVPVVLTNVFRFLNPMISVIVCGRLSKLEFDAVSLANSLINVLGVSIDLGFSTAFDTLFSQVYGANQKKKMGFLLQRAMLVMTLLYLTLCCIHLNIEPILIFLRQDPMIAVMTTKYLTLYLPGLFFDFQFLTISRYLQNQNIVYPTTLCGFIANIFNAVSQAVAIYVFGYGIEASAILQASSCFVMFAIQLSYILISKVYVGSWGGWSWRAVLENWKVIFLLGIPGIFMIGMEEWNYEIAAFVAGSLDPVQLGAQTIAFQYATVTYMVTMGLGISMTIRAGQYLGMNDIARLKTSFRTCICIGAITSSFLSIFTIVARYYIAAVFTDDKEIRDLGADCLIIVGFCHISDIISNLPGSLIKASGRQVLGASIMFSSYYFFGVPLGLVLIFVFKHNITSMWIGLVLASFTQGVIMSAFIWRTDWEKECKKASDNAAKLTTGDVSEIEDDEGNLESSNELQRLVVSDVESEHKSSSKVLENSLNPLRTPRKRAISMQDTKFLIPEPTILERSLETNEQLLLKRVPVFLIIICLFIAAILLRIFLPKSSYLPCIPPNNFSINYFREQPQFLCPQNRTQH